MITHDNLAYLYTETTSGPPLTFLCLFDTSTVGLSHLGSDLPHAEEEVVSTVRKRPSGSGHNVATARLLALLKGAKWAKKRLRQAIAAGSLQKWALQMSTERVTSGAHEKHSESCGGQLLYTENSVLCFLCSKDCRNTSWLRVKRSVNDLGKLQEAANSEREREKMRTAVSAGWCHRQNVLFCAHFCSVLQLCN